MVTLVFHQILALGIYKWLSWELKKPFKPLKHWQWLALNLFFAIAGNVLAQVSPSGQGIGNIYLHAIGGGMATAATYEYLKRSLNVKLNWRVDFVFLFMFVSTFGVMNELYEYAADVAGLGQFSIDRFDTWKDFVANTSGAVIVWALVKLSRIKK